LLGAEFKSKRKEIFLKLNKEGRGNVKGIGDLVLINFRLFADFQDRFKNGEISLTELINHHAGVQSDLVKESRKLIRSTAEIFRFYTSTDHILHRFIKKKLGKYVTPSAYKNAIAALFPNEPPAAIFSEEAEP
jgi:hypothetical protein